MEVEQLVAELLAALAPQLANEILARLFPGQHTFEDLYTKVLQVLTDLDLIHEQGDAILAAISAVRVDTTEPHLTSLTDLADQLSDIQGRFPYLVRTDDTPPWYTAPSGASPTAEEIWNYDPTIAPSMLEIMRWLDGWRANLSSNTGIVLAGAPGFMLFGLLTTCPPGSAVQHLPTPDWTDILDTDTRLSWLQRTDTANTWVDTFYAGEPTAVQYINGGIPQTYVQCAFTETQFQEWKLSGTTSGQVAAVKSDTEAILAEFPITFPDPPVIPPTSPVWPGADLVTLGTPVALVDGLVVDGPMDGCLVNVTTEPKRTGHRVIGGQDLWYGMGEVSFGTDDGYLEPWVYMGFATAIFTPKTMKRADHAYFRVLGGAGGTVTPWTKTV